jgi:hypothetical protein
MTPDVTSSRRRVMSTVKKKRLGKRASAWSNYEEVAHHVLGRLAKRFGLREVQGKQKLRGYSGTDWEIDAVAFRERDGAPLIVECRLYKRSLSQEAVAAVAYRIRDTGAAGGFTVSPRPLQKGARKVAARENVQHVQLAPESTRDSWLAKIGDVLEAGLNLRAEGRLEASVEMIVTRADGTQEHRSS